ncbi:hypothetical protein FK531_13095 [Rhodococcus spelaei]|uniref:Alkaline shock response membrane anchor protein AmaP n=1 Tax=Rhodococcus spelaei TaxID=2546320 RepID=A0A541B8S9_9NOCA|nr:hypothetical protein [Rhodococcus spelaei]TQF68735.1 hypothetical protein FK531_13095 [Rhodococcus spelaei]
MKRRTAVVDRLVVLAAGGVLLAGGALAVSWRLGLDASRELVSRLDRARVASIPDQSWWPAALGATCVLTLVAGITLLLLNLRRGRTSTAQIGGDLCGADLSVDLGPMAVGLAGELSALDGIRTVRATAVDDRGLATLRVTVIGDPSLDLEDFTRSAEAMAQSMAAALPGAAVATQVLLHLDPVEQPG